MCRRRVAQPCGNDPQNLVKSAWHRSGTQTRATMILCRSLAFTLVVLPLVAGCTGTVVSGGGTGGEPESSGSSAPRSDPASNGGAGGAGGQPGTGGTPSVGTAGGGTGGGETTPVSCQTPPECTLGQTQSSCCGYDYDYGCVEQTCVLVDGCAQWNTFCSTPLVISFDGAPVEYTADASHAFRLSATAPTPTDWPTARTPWLALDRNGNGSIDDGDRRSGEGELEPVSHTSIVSIDLRYAVEPRCDTRGNCEVERAPMV